jgi:hypothetical protein
MGSLFSKPSTPKPPAVQPIPPVPELEEDEARRFMKKRKGRAQTVLTGDLVPADTGQKTLLGG